MASWSKEGACLVVFKSNNVKWAIFKSLKAKPHNDNHHLKVVFKSHLAKELTGFSSFCHVDSKGDFVYFFGWKNILYLTKKFP